MEHAPLWTLLVALAVSGCAGGGPILSPVTDSSGANDPMPSTTPGNFGSELIDTGRHGAEPTIGIDRSGAIFVMAYDDVLKSIDAGIHWTSVHTYTRTRNNSASFATLDPYLFVDVPGNRVLVNHLRPGPDPGDLCTFLAVTSDAGKTWMEHPMSCPAYDVDHPRVAGAGLGPSSSTISGLTAAETRPLYLCYSTAKFVRDNQCATSFDNGATWTNHETVITRTKDACGGLGGAPLVAPDGTFAIVASFACKGPVIAYTRDNGETWSTSRGPQDPDAGHSMDPEAAFDPDGGVLAVYRRADQRVHLARTPGLGQTWSGPWTLAPDGVGATMFETISIAESGRVGIAFLGTEDSSERPGSVPDGTHWHLHAGVGDVGAPGSGPAIEIHRITSADDPVQVGPICVTNQACPQEARNLLDFIDSAFSPAGDFYVAYTDGCITNECRSSQPGDPSLSRASRVMVARIPG